MRVPERERGPLVIAYRQDGHDHVSGAWTEQQVAELLPEMEKIGCVIIRVYDGIAEAKAEFPPGTRVIARRKHWKSPLGTVATDAEIQQCKVRNCHAHGWHCDSSGAHVPVRFDGDEGVLGWWAGGLEVIGTGR